MPRVTSPLHQSRPRIEVILIAALGGQQFPRILLADSGAGSEQSLFELVLDEDDCLICGTAVMGAVQFRGAYSGTHPIYSVRVQVPQVGFDAEVEAVGVSSRPTGFDGIAGFRFLDRFNYGNFGVSKQFGLEM